MTRLNTLRNDEKSSSVDINDSGMIVGSVAHREFDSQGKVISSGGRLVMWQPNHGKYKIIPLDTLIQRHSGWTSLFDARRINNDGTILGKGWKKDDEQIFVLFTTR